MMFEAPTKYPPQWQVRAPVTVGWMKQFQYVDAMFRRITQIEGDVVECGLGCGTTFAMLGYLTGTYRRNSALWGFDSFQGWPAPSVFDESPRQPRKGEWTVFRDQFESWIAESGIRKSFPDLDMRIVPGFFDQTLPSFPGERQIALLHADCDLYPSYKVVLENLFPKVAKGGIVMFDEYREFPHTPQFGNGTIEKWPGATKAIDEYYCPLGLEIKFWPETGKYFVVKE